MNPQSLQELSFGKIKSNTVLSEFITDHITLMKRWRIVEYVLHYIKVLTSNRLLKDVILTGKLIRDVIAKDIPDEITFSVGVNDLSCVIEYNEQNRLFSYIKELNAYIPFRGCNFKKFQFFLPKMSIVVNFFMKKVSKEEFPIIFDVDSLMLDEWTFLTSYCGRKADDPISYIGIDTSRFIEHSNIINNILNKKCDKTKMCNYKLSLKTNSYLIHSICDMNMKGYSFLNKHHDELSKYVDKDQKALSKGK